MPINGAIGGKTHAASGGKDASNFRSLPSTDQPKPLSRSTCPDITGPRGKPSAVCAVLKQQKPAPKSGNVVPILENENALPVYLESGFGSYERLPGRSTIDDDDSYGLEYRHMGSMDLLRASVDTNRTMLIAAKRPSPSSDDSVWSTIRPTRKKRLSRPASWMQLFTLASSSRPPSTSTQQVQRLKLRRWAKRTSFKTKARFKLVGRSVRPAKRTGFRARGRRWHRSRRGGDPTKTVNKNCEKQLKKKELKTKTKKGLGNVGKTLEVTRERVKQHRRTADHFFGVLVAKKSLQFGLHRSGKGNKVNRCHERAASCPLDIST
ncbi:hypothetical protein SAMD00023353_1801410 [Rosellinia necatrix]|uniref:Uncharacterized protein n=1 Tax=Rosellinia necatrix TaxID=77044 RepID=A0A1S8A7K6_ROSNE|nr:hypothetical protein SAMD00023353_1801410 [Rosellinia necatrix]